MTWTTPNTVATGDIYTAAMYNTYLRDNSNHLRTITGNGDPSASNQVNVSTGAGTSAWSTLPDAAMTNQKINKANLSYTSMANAAAVIANSGFHDVTVPSADAPEAGRQYHVIQSIRNDGTISYSVQIAIDLLYTTPTMYVRNIVAGTPSAWYKLWNAANDGSGSGLDADTLDGLNASNSTGQVPISNGTVNTNLNADKTDGYDAGNASGNIPISNGTLNVNLNADMLGSTASALVTHSVGDVKMYLGSSETPVAAKGWKFMNGQSLSRTTFSALFDLIGTTYGLGTNSPVNTTFSVPDWRGKFGLGVSGTYALGTSGGAATKDIQHSHAMPHLHTITSLESGDSNKFTGSSTRYDIDDTGNQFFVWDEGHHHKTSGSTDTTLRDSGLSPITNTSNGGSATQDIMPPYGTGKWCIYTGVAS